MADADRAKWDARYAAGAYAQREYPSVFLERCIERLPTGRALDLACGAGRNAIFLASRGHAVTAIDISTVAIERAREREPAAALAFAVDWIAHDLDAELPVAGPFDLVLQLRYVNPALTARVAALLAPGGVFLCEQHLQTEQAVAGPRGARFRVAHGELPRLVPGLEIVEYEETLDSDPDGETVALARLMARRPS